MQPLGSEGFLDAEISPLDCGRTVCSSWGMAELTSFQRAPVVVSRRTSRSLSVTQCLGLGTDLWDGCVTFGGSLCKLNVQCWMTHRPLVPVALGESLMPVVACLCSQFLSHFLQLTVAVLMFAAGRSN